MLQTEVAPMVCRPAARHRVAVAVPARNEAATIFACLAALDVAAARAAPAQVRVVVLVNNDTGETFDIARSFRPVAALVEVIEIDLPPADAHAGGARRAALDRCHAALPPTGILMTTDADSCVAPDWIAANLAEIDAGADAVAGVVAFDAPTRAQLPELPARALEWRLAHLHARLADLLDPQPHNPWPTHIWAWGASLALTAEAYRRVGGLPSIPLAEDRALADAIERHDLCLRRSHAPIVYTSARRIGRAPGGFADLLSSYASDVDAPCDAALEPTRTFVRRLRWRARLRRIHATEGRAAAAAMVAARLDWASTSLDPGFGAFWHAVEGRAPLLARRRLLPAQLPAEVRRAERLISRLEAGAAHPVDSRRSALAA